LGYQIQRIFIVCLSKGTKKKRKLFVIKNEKASTTDCSILKKNPGEDIREILKIPLSCLLKMKTDKHSIQGHEA